MGVPDISDYIVYTIEECRLFFNNREVKVNPEEILEFSVGCDFIGDRYFPEFAMAIKTDRYTFFDIMKEKDTVTMNLKIGYHSMKPQEGEDKGKTRIWFNDKFIIRTDDNLYDTMISNRELVSEMNRTMESEKEDVATNKEYIVDLYLFKERDINTAFTVSNRVYSQSDISTIVTHQLSLAGASKVLMSPLENKSLTEVVAMPYTLVYNLIYLANQYGLHSHGTIIFFDLTHTYILNRKGGLTAWEDGSPTTCYFVVREDDNDKAFMAGSRQRLEDDVGFINVDPTRINIRSYTTIDDLVRGGELKTINTKDISVMSAKAPGLKKEHPKYMHNKYGNSLALSAVNQNMVERAMVITITIEDSNIRWYSPNRDFNFDFMSPELHRVLGGKYKLLTAFMKFTNNGNEFRNSVTAELARC